MPLVASSPLVVSVPSMAPLASATCTLPSLLPFPLPPLPLRPLCCVADCFSRRVVLWSGDGQQHLLTQQVSGYAGGVCIDLHGHLHVSSGYPSHVVEILDPRQSLRLIQQLGKQGGDNGEGAQLGELSCPSGMITTP